MIKAGFADMMARYNAWQNHSLYRAADNLGEEVRRLDRGAFFGSIHGTLSHLLWGDTIWMSRFGECDAPGGNIQASPNYFADWAGLKAARETMDGMIQAWAQALSDSDLEGDLTWDSPALGRKVARPRSLLIVHFFNHQTHHRGQVHAMLTAAGARPEDTDLPYMPQLTD